MTGTVRRDRLYAWLDARRDACASVWLCGAPGAGKTTLAASYVQARALSYLWYRLDADDNDLSRFFSTMGAALDGAAVRTRRPRFAAEHLANVQVFARRWFAAALAVLPPPFVIVFDNVEQGALDSFDCLVTALLETAPPGVSLIITGRDEPGPGLAQAVVQGHLARL